MRNILKNTLSVLNAGERKKFGILIILDILISIADILALALLLWIIQFYIQPAQKSTMPFLPSWLFNRDSVSFIAVFVMFFAAKNAAAFLIARAFNSFNSNVAIRISYNNLVNYQYSAYENFVSTDSSAHIRNICFQPFEYCQYMLSGIQQLITQSSLILLTIIAILLFNAHLFFLLLLLLLPPVVIVFYFIKKRLAASKKHIRDNNERSFQYLLDALKGYVEGNIYNRNEFFLQRFITVRKKFSNYLFDTQSIQNLPNRIIEVFAVLGLFILIAIAKWTGNNDTATLLTIGAFMAAAYKIIPGIVKLINTVGQMKTYEFSITDLEQSKYINKTQRTDSPEQEIHTIELLNINFNYANQQVLHALSLTINKGDFIGISGGSGKGKTTIINLLLGFLTAGKGEITINGKPVGSETLKSLWGAIAYVRQQVFLIYDTLLKNITFQESGHDEEKLQYALQHSGLDDFIAKTGEGLNTIITENGKNISGGQQQRIAIARALYKDAQLIILDEPFNELDEASANSILEHLRQLCQTGKMVIMITHDTKSLSYCNKIISLDE